MDDEFLSLVRLEQLKGKFDLIVFDPLTGVTNFDISDNAKMNDYLLKKVDSLIKHDAETKCGLMIIRHSTRDERLIFHFSTRLYIGAEWKKRVKAFVNKHYR